MAVIGVKHANPCGVALANDTLTAYQMPLRPIRSPSSAESLPPTGEVDLQTAQEMVKIFLEIVIAPAYTQEALEVLRTKRTCAFAPWPGLAERLPANSAGDEKGDGRSIEIGTADGPAAALDLKVVTKPADRKRDARYDAGPAHRQARQIQWHCTGQRWRERGRRPGAGQSHLGGAAVHRACGRTRQRRRRWHRMRSSRLTIAWRGGRRGDHCHHSTRRQHRDADSIKAADELGITMLFTGMRHFKH